MSMQPSRRDFFRNVLIAGVTGAILPTLLTHTAQADDPSCNGTAAAKNLHYHDNAADLEKEFAKDKKLGKPNSFKDKAGKEIPVSQRHCEKCALYGLSKPGSCAVLAGCLVNAKGSCTSWSPKA